MFWRFGGYANISAIDTLLEKPDVTLEELLEESDLIQELKSHNTKLIEYLREDAILQRLLEYVVAPKLETIASDEYDIDEDNNDEKGKGPEDEERSHSLTRMSSEDEEDDKEKKRNRYAFVSAEILASDSWSLSAALLENEALLRKFWEFLASPPPLDPLQAGYFTKVNEALLDKKTEEMLELFKSIPDVVKNMLQHVDSPMVMDLLLKIISLEKAEGGQGIVDWLHTQDLMPTLLSFLSSEHSWATQTSAGDFLKAIITISANASQNEQSCIGPNELTRQLVSQPCVEKLISDMLKGGNPLTVGVGIVIEVIRKNNSDYDPEVGTESQMAPSSRDPIYLGTLLRMFAKHVPDFMALILSPDHTIGSNDGPVTIKRKELNAAFGGKVEPLGFDRFKTCELMAELLHCSNMGLLNERGSEELVRARDAEREKLRAEGKLAPPGDRFNLESDDLTMRSSDTSRLGSHSPDEGRRLGVQNASDDDGFEEVTHAQDLGDDAKDDFDEKLDAEDELLANIKTENYPSFLDKDDDEFVDEPLSSPRLNTEVEALQPAVEDPSLTVAPLSPTKDLSDKVKDLDVGSEAKDADSKPPSYDEHSKDASVSPDEQAKEALDEAISNQVKQEAAAAKAEEAVKTEDAPETTFEVPVRLETTDVLTPHPDDRPAPLFSKKKAETPEAEAPAVEAPSTEAPVVEAPAVETPVAEGESQSTVQEIASQVPIPEEAPVAADFSGTEIEDSTMVDVDGTIRLDNADDTNPIEVEDDFSSPVVGDYLKMQFVEHRVVPTILDFFFRFPWNNFLHNVVYDVVQQVFNGPMDRGYNRNLAVDLFETGDITNRIVGGQQMSDEAQQLERMRLGYMGHLTLIAEEVVKFTERHPPELLSELVLDKVLNLDWNHYVEVTLAETRERDNAILGGVRPDQNLGPRQAVMNAVNAAIGGGSSALADAGLNGNSTLDGMDLSNGSGTSGSGFGLGGGSLLSGFGSSSDEEDEDMDEDMNDDDGMRGANVGGAEFSRYISNPSTTTATSSTTAPADPEPPAFAPPPPPPLNIPPSRARRQLAARLALHQKAQESSNGDDATDKDPDAIEAVANPNPFADTDSDDELTIEAIAGPAGTTSVSAWDTDGPDDVGKGATTEEGFEDNFGDGVDAVRALQVPSDASFKTVGSGEEVGNGEPAAAATEGQETDSASRSSNFSGMWPFNHASRGHRRRSVGERYGRKEEGNDFFGSDSDSDEGFDGIGEREASGDFDSRGRKPSETTEARRRTSLDDEEVVEVGRGEGREGVLAGGKEGEDKVA